MAGNLRLIITEAAARSIVEQADYYAVREGAALARRWDAAVGDAIRSLSKTAGRGGLCGFQHPDLKTLRRIPVPGFRRHLIFYQYSREESLVRVVQVLHGARNLQSILKREIE